MQLTNPSSSAVEPVSGGRPEGDGIDAIGLRLQAGQSQLTAIAQELVQAERAWREQRHAVQTAGQQALNRFAAEVAPVPQTSELAADIARQQTLWSGRISEAISRRRRRLREDFERGRAAAAEATPEERAAAQGIQARTSELRVRQDQVLGDLARLRTQLIQLDARLVTACRKAGTVVGAVRPGVISDPGGALEQRIAQLQTAINEVDQHLEAVLASPAHQDSRLRGVIVNHALLILAHIVVGAGVVFLLQLPQASPWFIGSAVATQALVPLFTRRQRRRLAEAAVQVRQESETLQQQVIRLEHAARREFDVAAPLQGHLDRFARLEAARTARLQAVKERVEREQNTLREREQSLRQRLEARAERLVQEVQESARIAQEQAQQARLRASQALEQQHAERLAMVEQRWTEAQSAARARWDASLAAVHADSAAALARSVARHPQWSKWVVPTIYPVDIPVGTALLTGSELVSLVGAPATLAMPLPQDLVVPLSLAFPSPGSLLVRAGADGRARALDLVNAAIYRALAAFPPGRLQVTLIDPVGLGEAFTGLLDLAGEENSLLGDGVLNEANRIEQGLGDLISHVETVIQKRLRGRYATIADYNREAGEMQEPLHLVAVADFPAGFTERALERLGLLARSGARCGVHLLIQHDDRRNLPEALDLGWFRRTGIVLRDVGGRLVIDHEALHAYTFTAAVGPTPEQRSQLLAQVSRLAREAQRVELPFTAVCPSAEAAWSLSSAKTLRFPIGKCGADRLQYLELGRGTAQHVLVGGRTGSGKSTLFHILIASAALWYAPREIEFHLIDFKKGVEFKGYASMRLPHARVIAIESDREFGLSVLRQLDQELSRRGDAFRAVGAQDLAAHRASGGEHLPRIVLLIDEFQEFFTEDDAVARDAALLLDRFVRQGRAFGLHVVLGSQTLGGAYALAKSSLGQMGVRIVLPCNEADAHLLLHEDNDGARLLTRPGDAIYNDQAGMVDGNSPFQVCWVSDEQEAVALRRLAARAAAENWRPAKPLVVFDGDSPSRLEEDPDLAALLATTPTPAQAQVRAWLGQSSSLAGAAEVVLPNAAGGNLLIIGQNRDGAASTLTALAVGLAARHRPGALRLVALDGEGQDGPFAGMCTALAASLPHGVVRHEPRQAGELLADLEACLERRRAGEEDQLSAGPILLSIFALQRLRALRPDDDLSFERGADTPPAERFARILANGPEYGIHVAVWCDSLASVQRGLPRRALRDFESRVLFQMSVADSSELMDGDAAGRLGLHGALLVSLGDGRLEKFRPCTLPSPAILARLGQEVKRRFGVE